MRRSGERSRPRSCDTFVSVGGEGAGHTIFGKNSDRPATEAHEVVRFARAAHPPGTMLQCQYIQIPQAPKTHAVILSRPAWLWGAEMGANEHGVCVGNEAVNTRLASACDDGIARLLGMDLVRLALERSTSAREALSVMTALLEEHGQGGSCEEDGHWCYENGFLICDATEAFILETAGAHWWASERVGTGQRRNISNGLSIRVPFSTHAQLLELCRERKWWDGSSQFDWKAVLGGGGVASANLEPYGREGAGRQWLDKFPADPGFEDMAACLRDTDSGICMQGYFESTGSQISLLSTNRAGASGVHWFCTGSDPSQVCYKPFAFGVDGHVGPETAGDETKLWRAHKRVQPEKVRSKLMALESELLARVAESGTVTPEDWVAACDKELQILAP